MSQSTAPATENVRVRRTRKLLRDALIELIEERGFDRLTVGEITERAMVSRAAFYRNHHDKFDLAEQIFDDAIPEVPRPPARPGQPAPAAAVHEEGSYSLTGHESHPDVQSQIDAISSAER